MELDTSAITAVDHFHTHISMRGSAPQDFFSPSFDDAVAGLASLTIELLRNYPDASATLVLAQVFVPPADIAAKGARPRSRIISKIELDNDVNNHPGKQ